MKKFLLAVVFLIFTSFTCQAEAPNPDVWTEGGSSKTFQYYLYIPDLLKAEKQSGWYKGYKIVNVWMLKASDDETSSKEKYQFYMDPNNKQLRCIEWVDYDKNGKVINSGKNNNSEWQSIIPESVGETNYIVIDIWASPLPNKF